VADLKGKGATALDDAQLKDLIVGKTLDVRNTVTGQRFEIIYGADGKRVITSRDGKPSAPGDLIATSELGMSGESASYEIRNGRVVTIIGGTPFDVMLYKDGDKYVAARSNEFGYANYEVQVTPAPTR